jgi:hypothetical protein
VVPEHNRPGDALAERYRLTDLLTESAGGRFWRAFDTVLQRDVAVHIISCDDERAPLLRNAARTSATVLDRRMLRVLDIDEADDRCFVVNEWGSGTSLDILLAGGEPLPPAVAAWVVAETADTLALAHEATVAHGRLVPENILIDTDGAVRLIGFAVDAALHGLPAGRISTDVADLAGLLYAGLTAKWAGVTRSVVASAPADHGHVLRPRQVRAGIPRTLDSLCDHILNHGGDTEVTAAMLADSLRDFLGPSAASAEAWLTRLEHPVKGVTPVVLPPLPDPPPRDPTDTPPARDEDTSEEQPVTGDADTTASELPAAADEQPADSREDGLPTQAGMPIFHEDTDEVTWLRHHTEPAPPPPPFEPAPERPLFAPEPADGQPVRRPRAAPVTQTAGGGGGFWPWENTATGAGTGSGVLPAYVDEEQDDDRRAPGSSMLRLAGVVAACLLVLVACVIAFNLGRGRTPLGTTPDDTGTGGQTRSQSASSSTTASPIAGVTARDLDPQGSDRSENPDEARFAVDGNPATFWQTSRYDQQFGPGGLKTGVGLVLDLGGTHDVTAVDLTLVGSPTHVQVFVLPQPPATVGGATVAGETTITGTRGTVALDPAAGGHYVVVWLTRLPAVPGGFRGAVAEAVVRGD